MSNIIRVQRVTIKGFDVEATSNEAAIELVKNMDDDIVDESMNVYFGTGSSFSKLVFEYLAWSWDFALAEGMREDTTKEMARTISAGILRGRNAEDYDLVVDFLTNRVMDLVSLGLGESSEWALREPRETELTYDMVKKELLGYPRFAEALAEVMTAREDD